MADKKRKIQLADLVSALTPSNPPPQTTAHNRAVLFTRNYGALREAASHPSLMVGDTDALLSSLDRYLSGYDGPNDDHSFCEWAINNVIRPGVQRFISFYEMRAEHTRVMRKGIWSVLTPNADLGMDDSTFSEIEGAAWLKVFLELDDFLVPGTAKLSTRLFEVGRYAALTWRKTQLRKAGRYASMEDAEKEQQAKLNKERPKTRPSVDPDRKREPGLESEPNIPPVEAHHIPLEYAG